MRFHRLVPNRGAGMLRLRTHLRRTLGPAVRRDTGARGERARGALRRPATIALTLLPVAALSLVAAPRSKTSPTRSTGDLALAGRYEGSGPGGVAVTIVVASPRRVAFLSYSGVPASCAGGGTVRLGGVMDGGPISGLGIAQPTQRNVIDGIAQVNFVGQVANGDLSVETWPDTRCRGTAGFSARWCKPRDSRKKVPRGTPTCQGAAGPVRPKPGTYENNGSFAKHTYVTLSVSARHHITSLYYDLLFTCASGTKVPFSHTHDLSPGIPVHANGKIDILDAGDPSMTFVGAFLSATRATAQLAAAAGSGQAECGISPGTLFLTVHWCKRPQEGKPPPGSPACTLGLGR